MKKYSVVLVLLCLVSLIWANEYPVISEETIVYSNPGYSQGDYVEENNVINSEPVWESLRRMNNQERANSEISIEFPDNVSEGVLDFASWIEDLWNNGNYKEALLHFNELELLTDCKEIAISNSWHNPIPTTEQSDWGTDVRIGNRDSIYVNVLDIHRSSGNLFAILLFQEGTQSIWTTNISTDNGQTWSETYTWTSGYEQNYIDAQVVADHCYISYIGGSAQTNARIRRVKVTDGVVDTFPNGASNLTVFSTTAPDSIKEVTLIANQEITDNRLYYYSITANGSMKLFWDNPDALNWTEIPNGVTTAERGLDACFNHGYDSLFLLTSYIDINDTLRIDATNAASWINLRKAYIGSAPKITSIGAYYDTITCVYEYYTASNFYVRYFVNYASLSTWYWGTFDDTLIRSERPDLTAKDGGGVGVVYRIYTSPRELRYTWRNYAGSWSSPVSLADEQPYFNKPCIEYLGSGDFGVVYLSWNSPDQAAYFDMSNALGITEDILPVEDIQTIRLTPNPSRNNVNLNYFVKNSGFVSISLYDATGRTIINYVNETQQTGSYSISLNNENLKAGIYYVKVETPDGSFTKPMTILR